MNRYLVISPHGAEDCLHVMDLTVTAGYITHYDWGCESGDHTGWLILEAENDEEALLSVPSLVRNKARAIRIRKYTPEQIQEFHKKF